MFGERYEKRIKFFLATSIAAGVVIAAGEFSGTCDDCDPRYGADGETMAAIRAVVRREQSKDPAAWKMGRQTFITITNPHAGHFGKFQYQSGTVYVRVGDGDSGSGYSSDGAHSGQEGSSSNGSLTTPGLQGGGYTNGGTVVVGNPRGVVWIEPA